MTNEMNDSIIKQSQSKILIENTNGHITNTVDSKDKKVNNNNNDDICNADQLSPIPRQRRAKNSNNNILLEMHLRSKRGVIQEESPNKKRYTNRSKVPNAKNPNIKNEKDEEKKNEISPKRKAIFYNNKDYNILNLVHVTNKIYEKEHHLNKGIMHKKESYNSISLKDLINAGKISNAALKKNVVISVDLNGNNKHNHRHHKKKKTFVNKKCHSSKVNDMKELNESQDKACLSNYTKIKPKSKNNSKMELTELSNNEGEGEMTAKIHKRNFSKSKTIKINNFKNDFLEDDQMKSKSKRSTRIYVNKDKKKESPISIKNQTNDIEIKNDALKKNETAEINKVNQKSEKSKLLSCLLCCFSSKLKNDSVDEI
jgi:hypothetical protein